MSAKQTTGMLATTTNTTRQTGQQAETARERELSSNNLSVILSLLAVYVIWGSTYFAIRVAIAPGGGLPPFLMAGTRFVLAGALLLGYLKLKGEPWPTLKQWGASVLVGCLLLVGGNGLVVFAEQSVASGLAALAIASVPIFAALFAGLWGRWPGRAEWVGLLLGIMGVGLLNLEGNMQAEPLAAIALLCATASWALGSVWSRYLPLPRGMTASAAEMLGGGVVLTLIGLGSGESITRLPDIEPLLAWLYLVVFGSIVAFSAYGYLLQKVRPALATSYAYVNPVVAVALGVGLGGETVTWVGLVAMPVILLGVAIVVMARRK